MGISVPVDSLRAQALSTPFTAGRLVPSRSQDAVAAPCVTHRCDNILGNRVCSCLPLFIREGCLSPKLGGRGPLGISCQDWGVSPPPSPAVP